MGWNAAMTAAKGAPRFARKPPAERRRLLIEAAIRCLAEGGMSAFTIDRICREAGVSRGLINHHFDGKEALLLSVYETMTEHIAEMPHAGLAEADPVKRLNAMIEISFAEDVVAQSQLRAWLAVWGEVAADPRLRALHRKRYEDYSGGLSSAIAAIAKKRRRKVDAEALARMLIALIDGLWLEWCLDASLLSAEQAKAACYDLLEPHLGPIER